MWLRAVQFTALFLALLGVSGSTIQAERRLTAYEEVEAVILKNPQTGNPVRSVEELLPLLSKELRSNFTFIYQSRSPHGGLGDPSQSAVSVEFPRVVLFTADGKLSLAFTGDPNAPGFDTVEAIHFEDNSARFRFSEFNLKKNVGARVPLDPPNCLRCHGQDPKPISDSYPLWPGFYGSVRDTFPKDSQELNWYRKFLKTEAKRGVYQKLEWPEGTSVPPYLDPKDYQVETVEGTVDKLKLLPNTRLGMAWTELNRKRIQRKLMASPHYKKLRYGLLAGLLGCRELPLSPKAQEAVYTNTYYENEDRLQRLGYRPQGPGKKELDMMELNMYANLTEVLYVAQALEVESSDWTLAFEQDSLSYFDGILSSVYGDRDFYLKEDFIQEMLRDVALTDPEFKPFFKTERAYKEFGYPFGERLEIESALGACQLLNSRHEALGVVLPTFPEQGEIHSVKPMPQVPPAFSQCSTCHEGFLSLFVGRKLPFSDAEQLSQVLKEKSRTGRNLSEEILRRINLKGEGQMPPFGDRLNLQEKNEISSYLESIGS